MWSTSTSTTTYGTLPLPVAKATGPHSTAVNGGSGNTPATSTAVSRLKGLASALVDRLSFAQHAGLTFDGKRDLYLTLGYPTKLSISDYRARYERGDIAERIIEAYPRATWVGDVRLQEDPDPETLTEFEAACVDLFKRLDVIGTLKKADILAGIGRYSVILIGADGDLSTELPRLSNPDQVLYLTPIAEDNATIQKEITDASSPRFGLPEQYQIKVGRTTSTTRLVHWSRIIHVAEGTLEDEVFGKPRLRAIWNKLIDLDKLTGGGSEAAWKRMDPGMQIDVDPTVTFGTAEESALSDEVDEYLHGMRRVLRTRGAEINLLSTSVSSFGSNVDCILKFISGTTGIPIRILVGSERGELASSQDDDNWNDRVSERQKTFAEPVLRVLVDRLMEYGALTTIEEYDVIWPTNEELTQSQKADVVGKIAQANKAQVESGNSVIMTSSEIREHILGLDPIDEVEDDIEEVSTDDAGITANATQTEYQAVTRAAQSKEKTVAALFISSWLLMGSSVNAGELERELRLGNTDAATSLVESAIDKGTRKLESKLPGTLHSVFTAGANASLKVAKSHKSFFRAAAFEASFDATNPRALTWAALRSSQLLVEVTPDIIEAIKDLIREGIAEGKAPRVLARQIKEVVGLRSDQVRAISNLQTQLRTAKPGTIVERFLPQPGLRTQAGLRIKVPKNVTDAWINKQVARYTKMQHQYRARTIARTETLRSANAGQRELWTQARDSGNISISVNREWIVTEDERLRDSHYALKGQVVPLDQSFVRLDGGSIEPGSEPNCRCSHALTENKPTQGIEAAKPSMSEMQEADDSIRQGLNVGSLKVRGGAKSEAVNSIYSRMRTNSSVFDGVTESKAKRRISKTLDTWADSSGDSDPRSVALQLSIQEEFGISNAHISHFKREVLDSANDILKSDGEFLRSFVRTQYSLTQEFFAERGVEYVSLVRGAYYSSAQSAGFGEMLLQPASSFTSNIDTAISFATGGHNASLHTIRVPVSRILSTPRTGFGCLPEAEFVVLGGRLQGWTVGGNIQVSEGMAETLRRLIMDLIGE